jgi:hypothetical protein
MPKVKPCKNCPYKLGIVEALVNPCIQCELNGYNMFEVFQRQMQKGFSASEDAKGNNK